MALGAEVYGDEPDTVPSGGWCHGGHVLHLVMRSAFVRKADRITLFMQVTAPSGKEPPLEHARAEQPK